jgi:membrane protein
VPHGLALWRVGNLLLTLVEGTFLFALLYRVLPDVEIAWRDVWAGAGLTGVLFVLGNYLIGLYLRWSGMSSAYGAAGSVVVILLWVYYSSQVLLFGAEFTQVYARREGRPIRPARGAVPVRGEERAGQGMDDKGEGR